MPQHKILSFFFVISFVLALSAQNPVQAGEREGSAELDMLKAELMRLQKRVAELEAKQRAGASVAEDEHPVEPAENPELARQLQTLPKTAELVAKDTTDSKISLYSSLRPTYGYYDDGDSTYWDVEDALSNAGFKASKEFMPGWQVQMQGEWRIDIGNNGDFGGARRAYVALDSPYGRVAIGKQRPPQYLLIAEYVDIFNHANSPFAYDPEGLFFVNNLVSYQLQLGDITWMMAAQFDGERGSDSSDLINAGLGYDMENLHLGLSYLTQNIWGANQELGDDETWAGVLAYTFESGLYLAAVWQDKSYVRDLVLHDRSGHALDVSLAYPLAPHFRVKLGYFDFDDGDSSASSQSFDGFNATLEWLPADNLRFHIELLNRNYDYMGDFYSLLIGFRYDFSQEWQF
ncbi:porin [Shewanella sp.]|uniref:porin n=1 Tax=Shewanella sp. TaxID=50422 RepID=UPI003569052C